MARPRRSFIEIKYCIQCGKVYWRKESDSQKKWDKRRFHNSTCGQRWLAEHRDEQKVIPKPKLDFLTQSWRKAS